MSHEAVKRHILAAIHSLNIPLDRTPSPSKVFEVCGAAKLLRNRVLREYTRIGKYIESLKHRQFGDSDDSGVEENTISENMGTSPDSQILTRHDFMFISEMMAMENVVIPLLLAHGMKFTSSLLLQLLKFMTVMLLPAVPRSHEVPRQLDYIRRLMERCGTDEFFWLLIQCVVPITEKRSRGEVHKEDVVLLEIVLQMIALLFTGPKESVARVIGAFSRNHGIELFLVVLNQNYARHECRNGRPSSCVTNDVAGAVLSESASGVRDVVILNNDTDEENEIHLCDGNDSNEELNDTLSTVSEKVGRVSDHLKVESLYNLQAVEILESDNQLWKWNIHIVTAMSAILRCAQTTELAALIFTSKFNGSPSEQLASLVENSKHFREFKAESKKWRYIARSRNGAVSSNGLLVRGMSSRAHEDVGVIGYTSTLLGYRTRDPIEKVRDIDSKKRGRFVKGVSDDITIVCTLSLPTKIQLAEQCFSFICYGFEPLSVMVWGRLASWITSLQDAVVERKEFVAGHRLSGEDAELPNDLDKSVYELAQQVLNYLEMCTSLLRYTREAIRFKKDDANEELFSIFGQQWKCISSIITLEHIIRGFDLLRIFLSSPELRRRFGVWSIANYLAELFMTLNHLVDGDIVADSSVVVAAHALVSSIFHKEENVSSIFDLISKTSSKLVSPCRAGVLILLLYSVMRLMEKCSFGGSVFFLRKRKRKSKLVVNEAEGVVVGSITELDTQNVESARGTLHGTAVNETKIMEGGTSESSVVLPLQLSSDAVSNDQVVEGAIDTAVQEVRGEPASGTWITRTCSADREVNMGQYFKRLSTGHNVSVLLSSLSHWRTNGSDVNEGLVFLIRSFIAEGHVTTLFSASFLITMRDILTNGAQSHCRLYEVCDEVVYLFFNPSFAKVFDERKATEYTSPCSALQGSDSFLGFEVSLRCARSLFCFSSTEYSILEEKGFPDFRDSIAIPLAVEGVARDDWEEEYTKVDVSRKKRLRKEEKSRHQGKEGGHEGVRVCVENVGYSIDNDADVVSEEV